MFPSLPVEVEREIWRYSYGDVVAQIRSMGEYTDYWLYDVSHLVGFFNQHASSLRAPSGKGLSI